MKRYIPAIVAAVILTACSSSTNNEQESPPVAEGFEVPTFQDSDRASRIATLFPAIDSLFQKHQERNHIPGIAYGIVLDGELVYTKGAGWANVNEKIEATEKSLFRIASMTKSFTAMAILKLRDEGKLDVTDAAEKYIPVLRKIAYPTSDAPKITIQHLLTMSAGFPEDNPWGDRQLADTPEELTRLIEEGLSFSNAPAVQFEYSNLGYGMLGQIITEVSGKPYQTYITENILHPLEMHDTYWDYTQIPQEKLALGYRWEDEQWKEEPLLGDGAFGAMGGLITSIEDLSKYTSLLMSAWPPRNEAEAGPVKRSSIREIQQPWRFSTILSDAPYSPISIGYGYGLGWRKDGRNIIRVSHSGGLPGFGSEYRIFPEYGLGILSFSNIFYGNMGAANSEVFELLWAKANLKPRTLPVSSILKERQQQLVSLLPTWDDEELMKIMAENFFLDRSLPHWKKQASEIFEKTGKIVSVDELIPQNNLRGSFWMRGEKMDVRVFFTLTPEREPLIQQVDLSLSEKSL